MSLQRTLTTIFEPTSQENAIYSSIFVSLNIFVFSLIIIEMTQPSSLFVRLLELIFAAFFTFEYIARLRFRPQLRTALGLLGIIDIIVILSLITPMFIGNLAILRFIRSIYDAWKRAPHEHVSHEISFIDRNRQLIVGILNFVIFLFVMTILVLASQKGINTEINSYLDAFYFTVSTLTTTGFGDITPVGQGGRMISVVIMILGITLTFRLARAAFRKRKVLYTCPDCGLKAHDLDAFYCKHCGHIVRNEEEMDDLLV